MDVNFAFYERPLFYIGQHSISALGLLAFTALFATGLILARVLQSDLNFLREAGIEIPNPRRDIYIRSGNLSVTPGQAGQEHTHGASVTA